MTSIRKRPARAPAADLTAARLESLIEKLRKDLVARRVRPAFEKLSADRQFVERLTPEAPRAAALVGQCGQFGWMPDFQIRERSSGCWRDFRRRSGPGSLACRIRGAATACGRLCRHERRGASGGHSATWTSVLGLGEEVPEQETTVMAYFWKSQCHRKSGDYDAAMAAALEGERLARELGHDALAAMLATVEGWLLFQKGRNAEALTTLQAAEAILMKTDDDISLGNIPLSAYGRVAQAGGRA